MIRLSPGFRMHACRIDSLASLLRQQGPFVLVGRMKQATHHCASALNHTLNPQPETGQDEAGDTALHLAASSGHVPAVFHILSTEAAKKIDFWTLRNKRGKTAGDIG